MNPRVLELAKDHFYLGCPTQYDPMSFLGKLDFFYKAAHQDGQRAIFEQTYRMGDHPAPAVPEGWQPIDTAPWDIEVLVTGISGYCKPHDKFYINAYRVRGWHQNEWNDATGTHLSESGWEPTHWMPLPTAPKFGEKE